MILSSRRRGDGSVGVVAALVAQHGPQHVDPPSGEGQDGVGVSFTFRAFACVEALGLVGPADAVHGRVVKDALQTAVVSLGATEISADPAGVARDRCESGHSGKLVRTIEATHVAAGYREEFRTEQ